MISNAAAALACAVVLSVAAPWWGSAELAGRRHRVAVGAAIFSLGVTARFLDPHWLWTYSVLAGLWTVVAYVDWREKIIPNRLVLLTVLWGLAMMPWTLPGFVADLATGTGLFLFYLLVNLLTRGGLGMGDVKFSGAQGFVLGWPQGLLASAMGVWAAGIYSVVLLLAFHQGRRHAIALGPFLVLGGLLGMMGIVH